MPRSATDATRFTSTTPHASAKLQPPGLNRALKALPKNGPGPNQETLQQKVKRLRAAADKARDTMPWSDKVILRGRVWADRAHKVVGYSLMLFSVVAAGVTVFAIGDMIIFNRRKRREFFIEQKALHESAMQDALQARDLGVATEAQLEFLAREDAQRERVENMQREKAKKKAEGGVLKSVKEMLFSGLRKEEQGDDAATRQDTLGNQSLRKEDDLAGEKESALVRAIEDKKQAVNNTVKKAFDDEKERQRLGGPLDRVGSSTAETASEEQPKPQPKSEGWKSFIPKR